MLDFSDRTRTGISKLISRCALNLGPISGQFWVIKKGVQVRLSYTFMKQIPGLGHLAAKVKLEIRLGCINFGSRVICSLADIGE